MEFTAAAFLEGCSAVRLDPGLLERERSNVGKRRNEMAVKPLKTNDSAKSLIQHS
jgi:hypothetical protein